jgi:hypothetical protein
MAKSLQERITEAEQRCGRYLADANEAEERGQPAKAEKLRQKQQHWLDRMNLLSGDGDRPAPRR